MILLVVLVLVLRLALVRVIIVMIVLVEQETLIVMEQGSSIVMIVLVEQETSIMPLLHNNQTNHTLPSCNTNISAGAAWSNTSC
jgi:hypothetical protein